MSPALDASYRIRARHCLSRCAREPIHTPGAIQPYGVLLVVEPQSLQVRERAISHPGC